MAKLTGMRFGRVHRERRHLRGPRCQARLAEMTLYWRSRMDRDNGCDFEAAYSIDDKIYCKRHAGDELLRRAIEETGL